MKIIFLFSLFLALPLQLLPQPRSIKVEKLPLDSLRSWNNPQFSPSGRSVFFTTNSFNGIWEFSLETRNFRNITNDERSGYGFSVSDDESQIAYRRTLTNRDSPRKVHEIVVKRLDTGSSTVVTSAADVSPPVFSRDQLVYSTRQGTQNLALIQPTAETKILGIENTKIAVIAGGKKILLDPLGSGSYIWPSLSPDRTLIAAYDMDRGAFVCNLEGTVVSKLGRIDSPTWTVSGKWIVYMEDKDDGHRLISSDLFYLSPEGTRRGQLTNTPDVFEQNPQCSAVEKKIVYQSQKGEIFVMTYSE